MAILSQHTGKMNHVFIETNHQTSIRSNSANSPSRPNISVFAKTARFKIQSKLDSHMITSYDYTSKSLNAKNIVENVLVANI